MANGDGLMSIAMAENLDPLEKFALGFLSAAEQNQRKRYAEEAKFVREKTAQIKERITKQRGLYGGMKEKKRGQISQLRAVMPGLSDEVMSTILRSDDETIENLIKDARKDFAQNKNSGREGKFLSFSDANGQLFTGDPTIYDPRRKGSPIDELVNKQFRRARAQQRESQEQDFGQAVASFFGAATPTRELINIARDQAMDLRGYSSGLSGDAMDARQAMDQFFAAGGTASQLQRKGSGLAFQFSDPGRPLDLSQARTAVATFAEEDLKIAAGLENAAANVDAITANTPENQKRKILLDFNKAENAAIRASRLERLAPMLIEDLEKAMRTGGDAERRFREAYTGLRTEGGEPLLSPIDLQKIITTYSTLRMKNPQILDLSRRGPQSPITQGQ
tara:strand:+ start:1441 stop:2616 length:1176 start_codon:yes stop_codon:yes gene_type:complete